MRTELFRRIAAIADITERKHAEEQLRQSHNLLEAIKNAQSGFIEDSDKRVLFDNILQELISLTQSEYGLIGESSITLKVILIKN